MQRIGKAMNHDFVVLRFFLLNCIWLAFLFNFPIQNQSFSLEKVSMKNEIRKDWVMRFLIAFMISLQPERKKAPHFSEVLSLSEKRDYLPAIRLVRRGTRNPDLVIPSTRDDN